MSTRKKICFVVAVTQTATSFLKDHILALSKDYDIYLVANTGDKELNLQGLIEVKNIPIERSISLFGDCKAVKMLADYFQIMKFDAVHSITPKAGFLTALAAKKARVKHRIHIFTGQVWATRRGPMKFMLKTLDKLIARLDNHILVDGESQRQFLITESVIAKSKSQVLGAGSICGAKTDRFVPNSDVRMRQRAALDIDDDRVVFAFMGRLNRDKGVYELLGAFDCMVVDRPNAYLLIFGYDEENCMSHLGKYPNIKPGENFHYYGSTSTPELSLQAADVFCLPSYREGFGMSVVEASCLGLPVICSDAYGLADTMIDNVTGLRCKVADIPTLVDAMEHLYDNHDQRTSMGAKGRARVLELFTGEQIVTAWVDYYHSLFRDE